MWVRYWCILENFRLSCYISQHDLTLTLSMQLQGSRISSCETECHRPYSFKMSHPESGQCLFVAAEDSANFVKWFSEVSKGGRQIVSDSDMFYEIPTDVSDMKLAPTRIVSEDDNSSSFSGSSNTIASLQSNLDGVQQSGILMKASHTGKWKQRYCLVKDGFLYIQHSSSDAVPIVSLPLYSCSLELISIAQSCQFPCQFKLNPAKSGKCHTFAALTESDMYSWISALRKASCEKVESSKRSGDEGTAGNTVCSQIFCCFYCYIC